MTDVAVLGDILVDIIARLESYPPPGGDAQALETVLRIGGTSLNTALMLARLGLDVALIGRVGNDPFGELAVDAMRRHGLPADWVERDPVATTGLTYIAVTPGGQRTMLGGTGANRRLAGTGLEAAAVKSAKWLHLSSYNALSDSSLKAAQRAGESFEGRGAPVSIDIASAPTRMRPEEVERLAARASVVMPSEGAEPEKQAAQTVIRKLGERGCDVSRPGESGIHVPGFEVDVVDTTGAGDAFNAGYIAGKLRGLDERASALLANACGAAACTVWGAGDALPSASVVADLLRDRAPIGWRVEADRARKALGS